MGLNKDTVDEISKLFNLEIKPLINEASKFTLQHLHKFQKTLSELEKEQLSKVVHYLSYIDALASAVDSIFHYETKQPLKSKIIVNNMLHEIIPLFSSSLKIEFCLNQNKPLTVLGDEEELRLLIFNLIEILLQQSSDSPQIHIDILDNQIFIKCNGKPIAKKKLESIFDFPSHKKIGNIHEAKVRVVYPILKRLMSANNIIFSIKSFREKNNSGNIIILDFQNSVIN